MLHMHFPNSALRARGLKFCFNARCARDACTFPESALRAREQAALIFVTFLPRARCARDVLTLVLIKARSAQYTLARCEHLVDGAFVIGGVHSALGARTVIGSRSV